MAEGNPVEDYLELLEAMCLWKMVPEVLQLLSDWLEDSLTPTKAFCEPVRKKVSRNMEGVKLVLLQGLSAWEEASGFN